MPYKDPEKQRQAMRKISRDYRRRKKAEIEQLKRENKQLKQALTNIHNQFLEDEKFCLEVTNIIDHSRKMIENDKKRYEKLFKS